MISDAINSAIAAVQAQLSGFWSGLWAPISDTWPLWWSYGTFGLILLGAIGLGIIIRLFLPGDWAKFPLITIFVGILAAAAWLFGRVTMYNTMKAKLDTERTKAKIKPKPKAPPDAGSWRPFG